jgi:broad specificity phosphatase PhoE
MHSFKALRVEADFFLIRHGESQGNRDRKIQGLTDLPLTEQGIYHAQESGKWFRGKNLSRVISSTLQRAEQTARLIMAEAEIAPECLELKPGIEELDTGIFSNKNFDEIREAFPELYREFRAHSWEVVPQAEPIASLEKRAIAHWDYLVGLANNGHRVILTVTHVGFLQWLFKTSYRTGWQTWMPLISVANCGIFHIFVSPRESQQGNSFHAEWKIVNYTAYQR